MIKTRLIKETDKPPFIAVCESTNGHFLTVRVDELDYPDRRMKAEIIDGWKCDGMQTGTVRTFHPFGLWFRVVSTKHVTEKKPDISLGYDCGDEVKASRWSVSRSKRKRGAFQPIWVTFRGKVDVATVCAYVVKAHGDKSPDYHPFRFFDIHPADREG